MQIIHFRIGKIVIIQLNNVFFSKRNHEFIQILYYLSCIQSRFCRFHSADFHQVTRITFSSEIFTTEGRETLRNLNKIFIDFPSHLRRGKREIKFLEWENSTNDKYNARNFQHKSNKLFMSSNRLDLISNMQFGDFVRTQSAVLVTRFYLNVLEKKVLTE